MKEVDVHIEISRGSRVKYEYDHETNRMICDRVLHTPMVFPCNYGYIPDTLSDDGDPLDALVITGYPLHPGCYIRCKVIGVLMTEDEKGGDEKMILVPADKVDPRSRSIRALNDLPESILDQIRYFYEHYKDLEPGKWVKVDGIEDEDTAIQVYEQAVERFQSQEQE